MRLEVIQRADLAVGALAETFNRLKRADLSSALLTTPDIVPQAMGPLVRPRWVRSVPGPTGGYELVTRLGELNVRQAVETIDGPTGSGRCVVADRMCDATDDCVLHEAWSRTRNELFTPLSAASMESVAASC